MNKRTDFLSQEYTIDTPENVTFAYEIAGIGNRFIAALIDTIIIAVMLVLVTVVTIVLLAVTENTGLSNALFDDSGGLSWMGGLVVAAYALLSFIIFWGYYIFFEYIWNGQTPGKRWVHIRVVRTDGSPAGLGEVVIRNLVRIIDFLPSGYGLGLLVMFFSHQARRLGDLAAGTLVVKDQQELAIPSLAAQDSRLSPLFQHAENESLLQQYANVTRLSVDEYELIQDVLQGDQIGRVKINVVVRLGQVIARKLEKPVPSTYYEAKRLLEETAYAYRQLGNRG